MDIDGYVRDGDGQEGREGEIDGGGLWRLEGREGSFKDFFVKLDFG